MKHKCKTCRWFHPLNKHEGMCKKHAPCANAMAVAIATSQHLDLCGGYPTTHVDDWCGEHSWYTKARWVNEELYKPITLVL